MNHPVLQRLLRIAIIALGVAIATRIVPGIHCADAFALLLVALLLSFFNVILKPLLVIFTLPFILVTMGFGLIVINALLFLCAGRLVQGFQVDGFWPAVGGAIVVSLTNMIVTRLLRAPRAPRAMPPREPPVYPPPMSNRPPRRREKPDDVIDI
jgi:putative membrane protein